jgi:hypothetical protein
MLGTDERRRTSVALALPVAELRLTRGRDHQREQGPHRGVQASGHLRSFGHGIHGTTHSA